MTIDVFHAAHHDDLARIPRSLWTVYSDEYTRRVVVLCHGGPPTVSVTQTKLVPQRCAIVDRLPTELRGAAGFDSTDCTCCLVLLEELERR